MRSALIFISTIFAALSLCWIFLCFGVVLGKAEGRNEMQQEAADRGYGIFVYTNDAKLFFWNYYDPVTMP